MLDPKTRLMLYKLVNGEVLEAVNGCISTGKEACVFHANGGRFVTAKVVPIVKVYYYPTALSRVQITRETSTNIPRYCTAIWTVGYFVL